MSRNQLLPNQLRNYASSVNFSVDGDGNITPTEAQGAQDVAIQGTIVTTAVTTGNKTFSGQACARHNDVCQCSTVVENVTSGNHMVLGTGYRVRSTVTVGSTFEIYAVTSSGPVANASNGEIIIGTT